MEPRELQLKYKGNRCAHCGQSVQETIDRFGTFHRMFEFNHVDPARKHTDYDNLIRRTVTTEQLDELDKCVLLCRNCHGAVHAQNINITTVLTVTVEGRSEQQSLRGQVIFDKVEQKLSFFTDNELLILPYWVYFDSKLHRMMFGKELKAALMEELIPRTKHQGPLAIVDHQHRLLFGAIRLDDNHVEVEQDCRFWLIPVHAKGKEGTVWIRNGLGILKAGNQIRIFDSGTSKASWAYGESVVPRRFGF